MFGGKKKEKDVDQEAVKEIQAQLKGVFDKIQREIVLLLFTSPGQNDVFCQAAREVVHTFRELTPKITLREYNLDHKQATKWKVEYSPTLLLDPEHYTIRWYGAPFGEESRTFLEALIMMGYGNANISDDSMKILKDIHSPRKIKVFVSPTCPYCPQQAVNTLKAAIERPDIISLEIIDIQANPELAEKYSAQSVPQTYANEKLIAMGAQTEELFMLSLKKMEQSHLMIFHLSLNQMKHRLLLDGLREKAG